MSFKKPGGEIPAGPYEPSISVLDYASIFTDFLFVKSKVNSQTVDHA